MELADVVDSKSTGSDTVPVRVRPPAPKILIRKNGDFYFLPLHFSLFSTLLYRGFLEVIGNSE